MTTVSNSKVFLAVHVGNLTLLETWSLVVSWSLLYSSLPGVSKLYNLTADPKQSTNVIETHLDVASELHQKLVYFMRETEVPKRLLDPRLELRM